jgi:hypothetical protein
MKSRCIDISVRTTSGRLFIQIVGGLCLLISLGLAIPIQSQAQDHIAPQKAIWWGDLLTIPAVDTSQVEWLEQNADWETATRVFALLDQLSSPDAVQLLPAYYMSDASFYYLMADRDTYSKVDSVVGQVFRKRPPGHDATYVHTAYGILRSRHLITSFYEDRSAFQVRFHDNSFPQELLAGSAQANGKIQVKLRFISAKKLLDFLQTSAGNLERAEQLVRTPVLHDMMQHRSQAFYPMAATHEMMVDLLSKAGSDEALSQLYRLANPYGLFHYTEVRSQADHYEELIQTLEKHQKALENHLEATLAPYVVAGSELQRVIDFTFGDGADGWSSGSTAAIDLEYFKDDYKRLITTLTHESVHGMHTQFQQQSGAYDIIALLEEQQASPMMVVFATALDNVYREGIATLIAPPNKLPDAEQVKRASQGAAQLDSLATIYYDAVRKGLDEGEAFDQLVSKMRIIRSQGVQGAGPFYWLGKQMAQAIEDKGGKAALAQLLREDALVFFDAYRQAVSDHHGMLTSKTWQFLTDTSQRVSVSR